MYLFIREEVDKEISDPKRYFTAAALGTVITRVFGIRTPWNQSTDRFPLFVNKEKSLRTKFVGKYLRKVSFFFNAICFITEIIKKAVNLF